jgi:Zn-dependent protease
VSTDSVLLTIYFVIGLAIALVAHEYAHALVGIRMGDHSPKSMGRLSLRPKAHVDTFGSLVLPGLLLLPVLFGHLLWPIFAYGKPYVVNPWNLRKRDRAGTIIALAGPAANLILAFIFGAIYRVVAGGSSVQLQAFLRAMIHVNVVMTVFQLIPIPGMDGSRLLVRALSGRAREVYMNLEQYAALFILVIFFIFGGPIVSLVQVVGNGICHAVAGTDCL